jgi:hypothetical protein
VIFVANATTIATELPWKKWKQSENLTIISRPSKINELTEIKATAIVNSSLSGFISFIQDVITLLTGWLM